MYKIVTKRIQYIGYTVDRSIYYDIHTVYSESQLCSLHCPGYFLIYPTLGHPGRSKFSHDLVQK